MRAICKCKKCGHVWSCKAYSEPDVGIWCAPSEDDPDGGACPECGCEDFEVIDQDYDDPEVD